MSSNGPLWPSTKSINVVTGEILVRFVTIQQVLIKVYNKTNVYKNSFLPAENLPRMLTLCYISYCN